MKNKIHQFLKSTTPLASIFLAASLSASITPTPAMAQNKVVWLMETGNINDPQGVFVGAAENGEATSFMSGDGIVALQSALGLSLTGDDYVIKGFNLNGQDNITLDLDGCGATLGAVFDGAGGSKKLSDLLVAQDKVLSLTGSVATGMTSVSNNYSALGDINLAVGDDQNKGGNLWINFDNKNIEAIIPSNITGGAKTVIDIAEGNKVNFSGAIAADDKTLGSLNVANSARANFGGDLYAAKVTIGEEATFEKYNTDAEVASISFENKSTLALILSSERTDDLIFKATTIDVHDKSDVNFGFSNFQVSGYKSVILMGNIINVNETTLLQALSGNAESASKGDIFVQGNITAAADQSGPRIQGHNGDMSFDGLIPSIYSITGPEGGHTQDATKEVISFLSSEGITVEQNVGAVEAKVNIFYVPKQESVFTINGVANIGQFSLGGNGSLALQGSENNIDYIIGTNHNVTIYGNSTIGSIGTSEGVLNTVSVTGDNTMLTVGTGGIYAKTFTVNGASQVFIDGNSTIAETVHLSNDAALSLKPIAAIGAYEFTGGLILNNASLTVDSSMQSIYLTGEITADHNVTIKAIGSPGDQFTEFNSSIRAAEDTSGPKLIANGRLSFFNSVAKLSSIDASKEHDDDSDRDFIYFSDLSDFTVANAVGVSEKVNIYWNSHTDKHFTINGRANMKQFLFFYKDNQLDDAGTLVLNGSDNDINSIETYIHQQGNVEVNGNSKIGAIGGENDEEKDHLGQVTLAADKRLEIGAGGIFAKSLVLDGGGHDLSISGTSTITDQVILPEKSAINLVPSKDTGTYHFVSGIDMRTSNSTFIVNSVQGAITVRGGELYTAASTSILFVGNNEITIENQILNTDTFGAKLFANGKLCFINEVPGLASIQALTTSHTADEYIEFAGNSDVNIAGAVGAQGKEVNIRYAGDDTKNFIINGQANIGTFDLLSTGGLTLKGDQNIVSSVRSAGEKAGSLGIQGNSNIGTIGAAEKPLASVLVAEDKILNIGAGGIFAKSLVLDGGGHDLSISGTSTINDTVFLKEYSSMTLKADQASNEATYNFAGGIDATITGFLGKQNFLDLDSSVGLVTLTGGAIVAGAATSISSSGVNLVTVANNIRAADGQGAQLLANGQLRFTGAVANLSSIQALNDHHDENEYIKFANDSAVTIAGAVGAHDKLVNILWAGGGDKKFTIVGSAKMRGFTFLGNGTLFLNGADNDIDSITTNKNDSGDVEINGNTTLGSIGTEDDALNKIQVAGEKQLTFTGNANIYANSLEGGDDSKLIFGTKKEDVQNIYAELDAYDIQSKGNVTFHKKVDLSTAYLYENSITSFIGEAKIQSDVTFQGVNAQLIAKDLPLSIIDVKSQSGALLKFTGNVTLGSGLVQTVSDTILEMIPGEGKELTFDGAINGEGLNIKTGKGILRFAKKIDLEDGGLSITTNEAHGDDVTRDAIIFEGGEDPLALAKIGARDKRVNLVMKAQGVNIEKESYINIFHFIGNKNLSILSNQVDINAVTTETSGEGDLVMDNNARIGSIGTTNKHLKSLGVNYGVTFTTEGTNLYADTIILQDRSTIVFTENVTPPKINPDENTTIIAQKNIIFDGELGQDIPLLILKGAADQTLTLNGEASAEGKKKIQNVKLEGTGNVNFALGDEDKYAIGKLDNSEAPDRAININYGINHQSVVISEINTGEKYISALSLNPKESGASVVLEIQSQNENLHIKDLAINNEAKAGLVFALGDKNLTINNISGVPDRVSFAGSDVGVFGGDANKPLQLGSDVQKMEVLSLSGVAKSLIMNNVNVNTKKAFFAKKDFTLTLTNAIFAAEQILIHNGEEGGFFPGVLDKIIIKNGESKITGTNLAEEIVLEFDKVNAAIIIDEDSLEVAKKISGNGYIAFKNKNPVSFAQAVDATDLKGIGLNGGNVTLTNISAGRIPLVHFESADTSVILTLPNNYLVCDMAVENEGTTDAVVQMTKTSAHKKDAANAFGALAWDEAHMLNKTIASNVTMHVAQNADVVIGSAAADVVLNFAAAGTSNVKLTGAARKAALSRVKLNIVALDGSSIEEGVIANNLHFSGNNSLGGSISAANNAQFVDTSASLTLRDGAQLSARILGSKDGAGTLSTSGNAKINAGIGSAAAYLKEAKLGNVRYKPDTVTGDVYSQNITTGAGEVVISKDANWSGSEISLGAGIINIGGNHLKLSGSKSSAANITINNSFVRVEVGKSSAGSLRSENAGTVKFASNGARLNIVAAVDSSIQRKDSEQYTLVDFSGVSDKALTQDNVNVLLEESDIFTDWSAQLDGNKVVIIARDTSVEAVNNITAGAEKLISDSEDKALVSEVLLEAVQVPEFKKFLRGFVNAEDKEAAQQKIVETAQRLGKILANPVAEAEVLGQNISVNVNQQLAQFTNSFATNVASGDASGGGSALWFAPIYGKSEQDTVDNITGYDGKVAGASVGLSVMANESLMIGGAVSYVQNDLKYHATRKGDKSKVQFVAGSVYGAQQITEASFVQASAFAGGNIVKHESLRVSGMEDYSTASGKYKSGSLGAEVFAGYKMQLHPLLSMTPLAGVRYSRNAGFSYTETGAEIGAQNLAVDVMTAQRAEASFGLRMNMQEVAYGKASLMPEIHGAVNYSLLDKAAKTSVKMGDQELATHVAPKNKQHKLKYNFGASVNMASEMLEFGVGGDVEMARKRISYQGSLKLRLSF